jgi:hypothetical protein
MTAQNRSHLHLLLYHEKMAFGKWLGIIPTALSICIYEDSILVLRFWVANFPMYPVEKPSRDRQSPYQTSQID